MLRPLFLCLLTFLFLSLQVRTQSFSADGEVVDFMLFTTETYQDMPETNPLSCSMLALGCSKGLCFNPYLQLH